MLAHRSFSVGGSYEYSFLKPKGLKIPRPPAGGRTCSSPRWCTMTPLSWGVLFLKCSIWERCFVAFQNQIMNYGWCLSSEARRSHGVGVAKGEA